MYQQSRLAATYLRGAWLCGTVHGAVILVSALRLPLPYSKKLEYYNLLLVCVFFVEASVVVITAHAYVCLVSNGHPMV